jgi:site-specific DNA-adenine methylase
MNITNELTTYECVDDSKNYYNCVYAYQNKYTKLSYIGQAKNYNKRNSQHLKAMKDKDELSGSFDAVYNNPDDWYRVIIAKDIPEQFLDIAEAQEIQTYGTNYSTRGYNKTKGNNMTLKKSKIASKQLDLSGNIIVEQKIWKLDKALYSLNGSKGTSDKALPHIENIPSLIDITDFYEPFAGAANISRFMGKEGRLHDGITLHLNDANKLNYYKLRAVKESPDELIEAIHNYLPVNHNITDGRMVIKGKTISLKSEKHPDYEIINEIKNKFIKDMKETDYDNYSVELAAKLFVWNRRSRGNYVMFNDDFKITMMFGPGTTIARVIYEDTEEKPSIIREWSEFLNHYNTELTCMDYKNMEFENPETSFIYCDSPYPNTNQSSTEIDMDEYVQWLSELESNNYNYTLSCNHKCVGKLYSSLRELNPNSKVQTKLFYTQANSRKDKKINDGVLYNYIES